MPEPLTTEPVTTEPAPARETRAQETPAHRRDRVTAGTRAAAVAVAPLAPLFGLIAGYLVHHPRRLRRSRPPSSFGLDPTDLLVPTGDGRGTLHAWYLPGDPERVVVLGHGIGLDKSRSLAHARLVSEAGYTVVLFDFRNHGSSFDDRALTRFRRRFNDDLASVVRHLRTLPGHGNARVATWGFSYSTFPVVHTLTHADSTVDAVICDSGPTFDIDVIVRAFPRSGLFPVPGVLLAAPARDLWEAVYRRVVTATLDPPADWPPHPDRLRPHPVPMLFVAGGDDSLVPLDQARAMADRYPLAELLVVPGATHLRALATDTPRYRATVLDFLARAIGAPAGADTADAAATT